MDFEGLAATEIIAGAKETVRPWIENDIEILTEILGELRKERDCLEERRHQFLTEEREQLESFRAEYERTRDRLSDASRQLDESRRELDETRERLQQDVVRWRAEPEHVPGFSEKKGAGEGDTLAPDRSSHPVARGTSPSTTALLDKLGNDLAELERPEPDMVGGPDAQPLGREEETPAVPRPTEIEGLEETPTETVLPDKVPLIEGLAPTQEEVEVPPSLGEEASWVEAPVFSEPSFTATPHTIEEAASEFAPETEMSGPYSSQEAAEIPPKYGGANYPPTEEPAEVIPETTLRSRLEPSTESEADEEFPGASSWPAAERDVDEFAEENASPNNATPLESPEAEDDSSLEDYLTQFTKRFGISDWGSSEMPGADAAEPAGESEFQPSSTGESHAPAEGGETGLAGEIPEENEEASHVAPMKRRMPKGAGEEFPAAAVPADIDRMRNLANLSSERVLMIHELRSLKRQAKNQLALAAGAFIVGVMLIATRWIFHATDLVVWFASGFFVAASVFLLGHLWSTRIASEKRKELRVLSDEETDSLDEEL